MYNKISAVKNMILRGKPHILGVSEAELRKSHHNLSSLKVPGYQLLLPKSWEIHGKARHIIYIKKSLEFEQLLDLEFPDVQSIWVRAWLKSQRKIYFYHVFREHTVTLSSSMVSQRKTLEKLVA